MVNHYASAAFRALGACLLTLLLAALAGCGASVVADGFGSLLSKAEKTPESVAQADDAKCEVSGLKVGTAAYNDCRRRLRQAHASQVANAKDSGH